MSTDTLTAPDLRTTRDVTRWRIEQLRSAGYDDEAALVLALDPEVDLRTAVSLLQRGCPLDTALRILF